MCTKQTLNNGFRVKSPIVCTIYYRQNLGNNLISVIEMLIF